MLRLVKFDIILPCVQKFDRERQICLVSLAKHYIIKVDSTEPIHSPTRSKSDLGPDSMQKRSTYQYKKYHCEDKTVVI